MKLRKIKLTTKNLPWKVFVELLKKIKWKKFNFLQNRTFFWQIWTKNWREIFWREFFWREIFWREIFWREIFFGAFFKFYFCFSAQSRFQDCHIWRHDIPPKNISSQRPLSYSTIFLSWNDLHYNSILLNSAKGDNWYKESLLKGRVSTVDLLVLTS